MDPKLALKTLNPDLIICRPAARNTAARARKGIGRDSEMQFRQGQRDADFTLFSECGLDTT